MKYEIVVRADTNDADYITQTSQITEEFLEEIRPVIAAIKAKGRFHNWPAHDHHEGTVKKTYPQLTEDQIECFQELCPYGEYGIHTIESVVYYLVPEKTRLL